MFFRDDTRRIPLPPAAANQRGMALILALVMLTLMSLLGAMALSTSTTEISISGNYRSSQQAFYAAERAIEYSMTNEDIYDRAVGAFPVDLEDASEDYATHIAAGTGNSGLDGDATNQVDYLTSGALPPGTGSDPTYFQSRYYIISATGKGPHNTRARVESQVSRIVPK